MGGEGIARPASVLPRVWWRLWGAVSVVGIARLLWCGGGHRQKSGARVDQTRGVQLESDEVQAVKNM